VVAVAFRSLLRMCSGSSGAYNLTVRSSRRRFMASCYLSASGCCRFGCTSLRRGLTQVLANNNLKVGGFISNDVLRGYFARGVAAVDVD